MYIRNYTYYTQYTLLYFKMCATIDNVKQKTNKQ